MSSNSTSPNIETLPGEIWKEVPDFVGYWVSSFGRVYSFKGRGMRRRQGRLCDTGRFLKLVPNKYGYIRVQLRDKPKSSERSVHDLVLTAFVGPRPLGLMARHLNDVKHDNRLENLKWGTQKENSADAKLNGKIPWGERNPWAKLTERDVIEIRKQYAEGRTQVSLAAEYNVRQTCISAIVSRTNWKHVK